MTKLNPAQTEHYLEKFFSPKSVVVIGASATPGKPGNVVIRNLQANGFTGKIYLVNPRGGKIEGLTTAQASVPIYAAVGGYFGTLEAAMETRRDPQSCLRRYYAMPTDELSDLEPGRYILAKFTWRKPLAEAKVSACNPTGGGYVATLTDFPAPHDIVPPY